jgi:hypothetical protein
MFTIESYRDVLSENAHGGHIISSAWVLLAVLSVAIILFV